MEKIWKITAILISVFASLSRAENSRIDPGLVEGKSVPFIKHSGAGHLDSYLAMNLPIAPARKALSGIEAKFKISLKNRGEAHVTVVSPIEYWNAFHPHGISIEDINRIATEMGIQKASVKTVCLGKATALVNGKPEQTYFVVVESPDLVAIRKRLMEQLLLNFGKTKEFDPSHFFPHVTLGFTARDLYEEDGVVKDRGACID